MNVRLRSRARGARWPARRTVRLTYRGQVSGRRPARVFAQLVDGRTGRVVGNQITPIALRLDGRRTRR